ncbi:MAG: hypothetical protein ACK400_15925, partial [Pseudanabaena sp.]
SQYETDFGISSAEGAGNAKIGFLKASQRRAFKKPIFIMIIVKKLVWAQSAQIDFLTIIIRL